jgi:hypothetical protein
MAGGVALFYYLRKNRLKTRIDQASYHNCHINVKIGQRTIGRRKFVKSCHARKIDITQDGADGGRRGDYIAAHGNQGPPPDLL